MKLSRMLSSVFAVLAALMCLLQQAATTSISLDELERLLDAPVSEAPVTVSGAGGDSGSRVNPGNHGSLPSTSIDGSWSDILHRQSSEDARSALLQYDPSATVTGQWQHPSTSDSGLGGPGNILIRQLDLNERTQALTAIKDQFYTQLGSRARGNEVRVWPYQGQLSWKDFAYCVGTLPNLDAKFGVWPYRLGENQYLLQQASSTGRAFRLLSGYSPPNHSRVYFYVFREAGPRGSELFQFIGTFRTPDRSRLLPFRQAYLIPVSRQVRSVEVISRSLVRLHFQSDSISPVLDSQ